MVAHNLKRSVLGMLLGHNPADIGFAFGRGNKPLLAGGQCHFNLSHSGNWVALMVSRRAPVGIDVGHPSPDRTDLLEALVIHPDDRLHFTPEDDSHRFHASWTLKEAMSKCDGRGLDRPFHEIRLEAEADQSIAAIMRQPPGMPDTRGSRMARIWPMRAKRHALPSIC